MKFEFEQINKKLLGDPKEQFQYHENKILNDKYPLIYYPTGIYQDDIFPNKDLSSFHP